MAAASAAAPATTRGIRVATYDIGAKTNSMHAGPKRAGFLEALRDDIEVLRGEADVICLQECSPGWAAQVADTIPMARPVSLVDHGIVMFVLPGWDVVEESSPLVWPTDQESSYKNWRKWLQVAL